MKTTNIIILTAAAVCLTGCQANEYKFYSGDSKIQFSDRDTIQRVSFYFESISKIQDTVFFQVSTTGYTSDRERPFRLRQLQEPDVVNAVEGVHFKSFSDPDILALYIVEPGAVSARVPIVMFLDAMDERTTYTLRMELEENKEFTLGESDKLFRKALFSKGLLRPQKWTSSATTYYWGEYSYNKHKWMIAQTGKKWDDEFFAQMSAEPGSNKYWRDKLNEILADYLKTNPPLLDDNDVPISGFPS